MAKKLGPRKTKQVRKQAAANRTVNAERSAAARERFRKEQANIARGKKGAETRKAAELAKQKEKAKAKLKDRRKTAIAGKKADQKANALIAKAKLAKKTTKPAIKPAAKAAKAVKPAAVKAKPKPGSTMAKPAQQARPKGPKKVIASRLDAAKELRSDRSMFASSYGAGELRVARRYGVKNPWGELKQHFSSYNPSTHGRSPVLYAAQRQYEANRNTYRGDYWNQFIQGQFAGRR